jgi:hypothetical protein
MWASGPAHATAALSQPIRSSRSAISSAVVVPLSATIVKRWTRMVPLERRSCAPGHGNEPARKPEPRRRRRWRTLVQISSGADRTIDSKAVRTDSGKDVQTNGNLTASVLEASQVLWWKRIPFRRSGFAKHLPAEGGPLWTTSTWAVRQNEAPGRHRPDGRVTRKNPHGTHRAVLARLLESCRLG